jgi:hypothetical protein
MPPNQLPVSNLASNSRPNSTQTTTTPILPALFLIPLCLPEPFLTLRAVPIAAAVVGDGRTVPAVGAFIEMPAQGGGESCFSDFVMPEKVRKRAAIK